MSKSLPSKPSMVQLRNQAKDLLKAHRGGDRSICAALRLLGRFEHANDAEILKRRLALHDAQHALALEYGFENWNALRARVEGSGSPEVAPAALLKLARRRLGREMPYFPPQMVKGYVQALNALGTKIDYVDFAAATGWAFSFGCKSLFQ